MTAKKYKNQRTEELKTIAQIKVELEAFVNIPGMINTNWFAVVKGEEYQLCAGKKLRRLKALGWKAVAVIKKEV